MVETLNRKQVAKKLNDVLEVDYDAIAAYQSAIDRLDADAYKTKLTEFLRDHERHVRELTSAVQDLGEKAETSGDLKQILTQGKVFLANLAGDKAILKAMKSNEDQTNKTYEKAVGMECSEDIMQILKRGLEDERRHRAWLEDTIRGIEK